MGLMSTHLLDSGKVRVLAAPVVSLRWHWPRQPASCSIPGTEQHLWVSEHRQHGCCHPGEAPAGLHNTWATQAGRAPLRSRAQAQARWGVGWGWGLGNSGAQPDTPEESRANPSAAPPECPECPHSIPVLVPQTRQRTTASLNLQMGKLRLSEARCLG